VFLFKHTINKTTVFVTALTCTAQCSVCYNKRSLLQIQVHGSDFTSFYEQVPKEILPTELGGEAGSIAENWGEIT
jgi:hypothetical protein